jgi:nitroreductase/Pyruvate/2-oxoacid:ferredoxin oxidoreductase delta subunit
MNKITIDQSLCVKCGICSKVCPVAIISKDDDQFPSIENVKTLLCIQCGHCEAYCPKKALALVYSFETESVPDLKKTAINPDDLEQHLKNRRSVRSFKNTPASKESIEKVIDITRYAPTGKNYQNIAWSVMYEKESMNAMIDLYYDWMIKLPDSNSPFKKAIPVKAALKIKDSGAEMILRGAPHCAIVHVPSNGPMGKAAVVDALIAMSHFDIALPSFGLGGFWAGFLTMGLTDSVALRKHCMIPDSNIVGYAYGFGIPLYQTHTIPKRITPKVSWK